MEEEEKDTKVQKFRQDSIYEEPRRYEFGRLISSGMIGSTYMARVLYSNGLSRIYCVKRMLGKAMA